MSNLNMPLATSQHNSTQSHNDLFFFNESQHEKLNLICFPYAGGTSATFSRWKKFLPSWIKVCPVILPGRESRFKEVRQTDFTTLSAKLNTALLPKLKDTPFAIYGHSMGAWFAHELAVFAENHQLTAKALLVSGQRAPHLPYPFPSVQQLDDQKLLDFIQCFSTIDQKLLQHPEWVAFTTALLRDDLALCESHPLASTQAALKCPIHVFCNSFDPLVELDVQTAWNIHTKDAFSTSTHSGDHFFIRSQAIEFLTTLSTVLHPLNLNTQ